MKSVRHHTQNTLWRHPCICTLILSNRSYVITGSLYNSIFSSFGVKLYNTGLLKLYLSSHKPAIEKEHYLRPFKTCEERICLICKKEMEDKCHFLTLYHAIGVRAIFGRGGGKPFAQIFTKQSKRNEGHTTNNIGRTGIWKCLDTVFQGPPGPYAYVPCLRGKKNSFLLFRKRV